MNKKLIRLTESDLHKIVKKSVNRILKEGYYYFDDDFNADDVDLGGVNVDAINKVLFPDHTPQMAKDQMKRKSQYGLMNPPSVKESDLHKIVKESAKRIMSEVALKGKSGKTYSLHGNDEESWDIMTNLRQNQKGGHGVTQYNTSRNAKNAEETDAKNHPNRRSLNNANRVKASLKRTSDASKDIMAANESKLSRIVKESVRKVMREASIYPDYDSTTTEDIAGNGGDNIITCYGSPGIINGKYHGSGAVIYLSCNPPTRGMTRMYGQFVPVKVDVSNFYRAKDAWEAKKMVGLAGFKDEYSGILYHGNRDGDVCAVFDRNCIIG